jgi:iron complex outermembrane receptor protein
MNLRVRGRLRVIDVLLLAALAVAGPIPAFATETHQFDVPAEDAPSAIRDFASQAHVQILVAGENVKEKNLHPVAGEFSTEEGLRLLLADSGLSPQYVGDRSIALVKASEANSPSQGNAKEGKKTSHDFRVAQVDQGKSSNATSVGNQPSNFQDNSNNASTGISEIVVTAEKRSARLQDVPVPVTVIRADALTENNQPRLQDFYTSVPGLNMSPPAGGSGESNIAIRGITSGAAASPTVAVTVDDVPFGFSTGFVGDIIPDLDPADLAQIEVLRGPQGALYGASGLGGIIKYDTLDPSADGLSGRVQADVNTIHNGKEPGYGVRGSLNVPISSTLAVRASAFTREVAGYIDNPTLGINGINEERVSGGRLSALWLSSAAFSLKLNALFQNDKSNGADEVNLPTAGFPQTLGLGDLQQNYIPGIGGYEKKLQAYSATLKGKIDSVDFTSVTGYNVTHALSSLDYSFALGSAAEGFGAGVTGAPFFDDDKIRAFTQEVRASLPIGQKIDWLLGAYFTHQVAEHNFFILGENPTTGALVGNLESASYAPGEGLTYQEEALFTDLTVHFTDQFNVQIGGRESVMHNGTDTNYLTGLFAGNTLVTVPGYNPKSSAFTYLFTPQYKITSDLMTYVRLASGYRPGGGTSATPGDTCVVYHYECQFGPDKTYNYEFGVKGSTPDHVLSFDTSVYYIDWKDVQIRAVNAASGRGYVINGSDAKSEGVEVSVETRPLTGMVISAWGAYNDAALTKDFPVGSAYYGVAGNRLPFSTRFSGNLSINQDFVVTASATALVGATVSNQGDSIGNFGPSADRQVYPSFTKADLRAGLKYGGSWTANLYANNIADKRAVIGGGGAYNFPPYGYVVIQPRTVGLMLQYTF